MPWKKKRKENRRKEGRIANVDLLNFESLWLGCGTVIVLYFVFMDLRLENVVGSFAPISLAQSR